jgi:hypothetical protein
MRVYVMSVRLYEGKAKRNMDCALDQKRIGLKRFYLIFLHQIKTGF